MELNRTETNKKILEYESKGDFNSHINPIDWENAYKVDGTFDYLRNNIFTSIKDFFLKTFEINPFIEKINKDFGTKIYGEENLKNINGAIVTCNHVNKFDCLVIKKALNYKKNKINFTAAPFNNQKGHFGELMRAGGLMPLSDNLSAMRNFNIATEKMLSKNRYIVFYPEQAMWLYYRKPRPYMDGAYHYATKHNKPILPLFITFEDSSELDDEGLPKQIFHLHILQPIYPNPNLTLKENINYLKQENAKLTREKYETFYKTQLIYNTKHEII